ncbi:MAG: radical SAM protein [Leptospiraceae bacterium]|nr:radical SAM protein [Leptospiraceae bacterium]MCP5493045.1 radical SAM protein [Leptospiraceae bacterium]
MKSLLRFIYHQTLNNQEKWYPILAVYYLTYHCNFRCPYCSDGNGNPYYTIGQSHPKLKDAIQIVKNIKKYCDYLVITGGEPLLYPEVDEFLHQTFSLGFKEIIFTTNGYNLNQRLYSISQTVHTLVVSLDTLDPIKADKWFGDKKGSFDKILDNIQLAKNIQDKKFKVHISSVVTPKNIEDLYDVYQFAKKNNFVFAACPELKGVKANELLYNNLEYKDFYNFLIKEKKKGNPVYGSIKYLEYMRELKTFRCHPFTMLTVSPDGRIFYPCLEIGYKVGNILEEENLHKLRIKGISEFGPQPNCKDQCHSACALGFSVALEFPSSVLSEIYLVTKRELFRNL